MMGDVVQVDPRTREIWAPAQPYIARVMMTAARDKLHTIPLDRTFEAAGAWMPHFLTFARRRNPQAIYAAIERGEVQVHLVMDGGRAVAAIGTRIFDHPDAGRVGDLVWCGGGNIPAIRAAIPQLELFLGEQGCSRLAVTGRKGLERVLGPMGFELTQITLEKVLV